MQDPRPINTNIKTKLINPEKEKPSRWSFLKILREHSDLRLFYPEINPNAEVYKMRDNLYCIYYDGIQEILPTNSSKLYDMRVFDLTDLEGEKLLETVWKESLRRRSMAFQQIL